MDSVLIPPEEFAVSNITSGATVTFENNSKYATSYLWDFGNGTTSTLRNPGPVNFVNAGDYQVSLTTQNYCCTDVYTQTVSVGQSILTVEATATPVICFGDQNGTIEMELTGGLPPYDIVWQPEIIDLNALTAGTYTYTVTDAANEIETGSITVETPEEMLGNVTVTADDVDQQSTGACEANVLGGVPPYTYLWSNGATTSSINNLATGQYTVTITDSNNCTAVWSNFVDVMFTPLSVSITTINNPLACHFDENGGVMIEVIGGVSPYVIFWSPNAPDLQSLSAGVYNITITDAVGTTSSAEFEITAPDPLQFDIAGIDVTPATDGLANGSATVGAEGGVAPYMYDWSTGATGPTAEDLAAGNHVVTVTDSNGCTNSIAVEVGAGPSSVYTNNDFTFQLFPNPVLTNFNIKWSESTSVTSVRVYDVLGATINVNASILATQIEVAFPQKPAVGLYYLELTLEDGRKGVERFVVK